MEPKDAAAAVAAAAIILTQAMKDTKDYSNALERLCCKGLWAVAARLESKGRRDVRVRPRSRP